MNRTSSSNPPPSASSGDSERVVLVGDVGGTNARFGVYPLRSTESPIESLATVNLLTAEFSSADALLTKALEELLPGRTAAACSVAIAGPVAEGRGALTNGTLSFSETQLRQMLNCPAQLMNDFYAVAASISDATLVRAVGELAQPLPGVRAVIGPGTGLGMGFLVPVSATEAQSAAGQWRVFASEGGNADFAPVDALELEILGILQRDMATISIETLVSGRGLPNLYAAVCELWGAPIEQKTPAQISAAALSVNSAALSVNSGEPDIISLKTLELFCAMLGTAAGNFALNVGARGGVYLAGGILPRMRDFFCASDFRRRFDERGALSQFNKQIPTFLVLNPEPGLTGAVMLARRLVV